MADDETNVQPATDGAQPQPPVDTPAVTEPAVTEPAVPAAEPEVEEGEESWVERAFPGQSREQVDVAHEKANRELQAQFQRNAVLERQIEELRGSNPASTRVETPASTTSRASSIDAIKAGILERFGEEDGRPFLELIELVAPLQRDKAEREQATVKEVNQEFDSIMVEFGRAHPEVVKIEALATLVQQEVERELFPYGGLQSFIDRVNGGKASKSEVVWYKGVLDHAYENVKAIKSLGLPPTKQRTAPAVLAAAAGSVPNATTTTPLPGTVRRSGREARESIMRQRFPGK